MTREMVMELLTTAGADLEVDVRSDGTVAVTVQDFEGFDEDWSEVERELDDEERVDAIEEALEQAASSVCGDYYRYFEFDGFTVQWGYASFDI